jgi:adenylate cyclase
MDAPVASETLAFEGWRFDPRAGGLLRRDATGAWTPVSIGARARDILEFLLEQAGALVSKDAIMDAAWPNVVVEPNNLTVQIAALCRVLDEGRAGDSCIQTVPGRGYRFVLRVTRVEEAQPDLPSAPIAKPIGLPTSAPRPHRPLWHWSVAGSCAIAMAVLLVAAAWHGGWFAGAPSPPRLSIVVLPFENLSGDAKDDYLADGITDDLTTELSRIPGALVVARESAYSFKGKAVDVRTIGEELGVRYALEGSVRRLGSLLRVNVQLVSAETGLHLWSDRFDEALSEMSVGQEQIIARMRDKLSISVVDIENARSLRERPTNPDAFDLILRARSIRNLPPSPERDKEALALLERALSLDPTSVYAMTYIAFYLTHAATNYGWGNFEKMQRAERLLARAREIAPDSEVVLNAYVLWLRTVGRCSEAIEAAERALNTDPNRMRVWTGIYNELAICKVSTGHADVGLALQQKADQLNPLSPWKYIRYEQMGWDSFLLGRDHDAIMYLERSLAMHSQEDAEFRWRRLAAAYALIGHNEEARQYLFKADRSWPYDTVRSHFAGNSPGIVLAEQVRRFQEGLRLAGERDHANEDADFGVPADAALHDEFAGRTPTEAPGVTTIRTADLARFIADARPVVIDTVTYSWGRSLPEAVGLRFSGLGGSLADAAQDRLRSKMRDLTSGDLNRPIVAVGWNSERFDGRNLALRLAALGYTHVNWYRGGREAWEVAGLPETKLDVQEW